MKKDQARKKIGCRGRREIVAVVMGFVIASVVTYGWILPGRRRGRNL